MPLASPTDAPPSPNADASLAFLDSAITDALARIDAALPAFTDAWPEPSSVDGVYAAMDNTEWTNGFWTGMLWLAYELTGQNRYRDIAQKQVDSFHHRVFQAVNINHHDLGFLYSLSCVASWRLTGSPVAREAALEAAHRLLDRYLPQAGIIQAWGDLSDLDEAGRMIIDCNLNLPLLYWAADETGDARFSDAARSHIKAAQKHIVRPDNSTFHTFHMDPATGAPKFGSTHQGLSDSSCWARGQAWGISGFPLNYRYFEDASLIATSENLADYFLARLPADKVCCWDLVFTDDGEQRDSSAAAIAACGLLELAGCTSPEKQARYRDSAIAIVRSLAGTYASKADDAGNGLLAHSVYHMPKQIGVDEYCIWGDYFYLEALVRLRKNWVPYW